MSGTPDAAGESELAEKGRMNPKGAVEILSTAPSGFPLSTQPAIESSTYSCVILSTGALACSEDLNSLPEALPSPINTNE